MGEVIDSHACGDDYPRQLGDLYCPLADYVAAQHPGSVAVNYQFAKADFVAIDDRTCSRVEA